MQLEECTYYVASQTAPPSPDAGLEQAPVRQVLTAHAPRHTSAAGTRGLLRHQLKLLNKPIKEVRLLVLC